MRTFQQSEMLKRLPTQFFEGLVKKVKEKQQQGHDIINLGQGNPDLPTPPSIIKALQQAAEDPFTHQYSPFQGYELLKEAVSTFYKREYGVEVDAKKEVAILFGSKAGLAEISPCLLNPGDIALLPDPGYPDYMSGIALANAESVFMPLLEKNNFLPDYTGIPEDIKDQAKLMFLNYPNNPTTATASQEFFDETVDVAKKHNLCIVHDFAYGALGFDGKKPQSFLQSEGAKDVGVEMYTLSKTYNMAGWRVAFAVGNQSVIQSINLLQDHMFMSLFGGIQYAAIEALTGDQQSVRELVQTYQERRDRFIKKLQEVGIEVEAPNGTFFVWIRVPAGYTSEEYANLLLEQAHVVAAPGVGFGNYGEGYIRLGLLADAERLEEAAIRIGKL
ncbi:aminotransferase [Salinibacillus kushneri]|uniref:Aminotransferase n=1 Tax=Salinibacillus kushneri TaxID=237682 RepID=A0A1H9ZH73_9BACI|nr:pyridoxal phosphate-dependent aminotransferase [Salinibacillus kushneri]SES80181.1 aminotransferase [Salinibacillus kushneri]